MTQDEPDDEALLSQVAVGDEDAFRMLFRRHSARLYGVTLRLLGGRVADSQDAVQEAWLRAIAGLATFRRASTFATWLTGIGIRCALEIGRKRGLVADAPEAAVPMPERARRLDVESAVRTLAPGYRAVLVLHDLEGYTHREIAELLGIDEGTSKSQLCRARNVMRTLLGVYQEEFDHDTGRR